MATVRSRSAENPKAAALHQVSQLAVITAVNHAAAFRIRLFPAEF